MRLDGLRRKVRAGMSRIAGNGNNGGPDLGAMDDFISTLETTISSMDSASPGSASSFAAEFDALQRIDRDAIRNASVEFASSLAPENALRNRYPNIMCNERTRWRRSDLQEGESEAKYAEDFINANCIDGFGGSRGYIGTQAPPPGTMAAFWAMIYHERSPVIVCLNRPQEVMAYVPKCDRYWPAPGECAALGHYYVLGGSEEVLGPIVVRRFTVGRLATSGDADEDSTPAGAWDQTPVRAPGLGRGQTVRTVEYDELQRVGAAHQVVQLQYTEWPDQAVPDSADGILRLSNLVDALFECAPGRPVVHCSAGVGRTGTFISIHKLVNAMYKAYPITPNTSIASPSSVPKIHTIVAQLKSQRSKSVQTWEQYRFIFIALLQSAHAHRDAMRNVLQS